jgi:hypothetical protein
MSSKDALPGSVPGPPAGSQVTAWTAVLPPRLAGLPPRAVMLALLNESFARAHLYGDLLRQQQAADRARSSSPGSGLVGFRTARAPDGSIYPTGEEPRALVTVELKERQNCAALAMQCHALGITGDEWPL